jgi:hypothetical protein
VTDPGTNRNPVCPACALPAIPIAYGYPSQAGMKAQSRGRITFGGCDLRPGADNLCCPRGHRWFVKKHVTWRRARGRGGAADEVAAFEVARERNGVDDPTTLAAGEALASRLFALGDYDAAEDVYRSVLASDERVLGHRHAETMAVRHALSILLFRDDRPEESDREYEPLRIMELERQREFLDRMSAGAEAPPGTRQPAALTPSIVDPTLGPNRSR